MPQRAVIRRAAADRDVERIVDRYLLEAGADVALAFIAALESGYGPLARHPGTGSPRYAHELNIPGLRSWPLRRYPYLVFYFGNAERIEIWRVLHNQLDLPAWLQAPADPDAG